MASWLRVAAGLQLVAEQAAKHAASKLTTTGTGAAAAAPAGGGCVVGPLSAAVQRGCDVAAAAGASLVFNTSKSKTGSPHQPPEGTSTPEDANHCDPVDSFGRGRQEKAPRDPTTNRLPPDYHERSPTTAQEPPEYSATTTIAPAAQGGTSSFRAIEPLDAGRVGLREESTDRRSQSSQRESLTTSSSSSSSLSMPPSPPAPPPPESTTLEQATSTHVEQQQLLLKEGRPVPSTRIGRAAGFAQLGLGLAWGAATEGASRLLFPRKEEGPSSTGTNHGSASPLSASSIMATDANSDRLASTLCRMRGAALKMGQMLSIQDESLLPAGLQRALRQVRQGAEAMPRYQLEKQMESQLGKHWRTRFERFDDLPFAAASIGQVHRACIRSDAPHKKKTRDVVVKVQYPGVARSIKSDLRNLSMLVTLTGMAPPGLFIENVIRVGEQELSVECDYRRELVNQRRVRDLVEGDPVLRENRFVVPDVVPELSTDEILTSEYRPGGTIDKVSHLSQEERNRIGRTIMYLTMKELFVWRFMQTDPNWGNFLYDVGSGTTSLIDFGATREYSKSFVDGYLRIVWASANRDEDALMEQSYRMKFLTGEENEQMLRAHKLSGYTVGEPFHGDQPFDFCRSNVSTRMGEHTSVFLRHRLTPPPEEVYTLHRKLAGAYMLCIKLGAVIECRSMLQDIVASHRFEDGLEPLPA